MVRNGYAHLNNFGVLYRSSDDVWLAPMFDVVTTSICQYTQCPGGSELNHRTMVLRLFSGKHQTKVYPTPKELLDFGHLICGVSRPLQDAKCDDRVPPALLVSMKEAWSPGMANLMSHSRFTS